MGHKDLLVTRTYRRPAQNARASHAKRLPSGLVQTPVTESWRLSPAERNNEYSSSSLVRLHSCRKAVTGSIRTALRAGRYAAASATVTNSNDTPA
jgi:hypothetical protein